MYVLSYQYNLIITDHIKNQLNIDLLDLLIFYDAEVQHSKYFRDFLTNLFPVF